MEAKFEKIRKQANSKLENQKLYAQTLLAIEETIREQNVELTPTAYFGAMITTLQATDVSSELTGALLYLLDEVFPQLPHSVLRSKFGTVMPLLENAYEQHKAEQPVVRSVIGCIQELLIAQDGAAWSMPVVKKIYQLLLILSADASPKARKRAQDAVRSILSRPPPPTIVHPAAVMSAEFILRVLHETTKSNQHAAQQILALLQSIVPYWPPSQFVSLCQALLQLPKFNNIFLTKGAFDVFESLFDAQETDIDDEKFASLLQAICELKPAAIDERLLPAWLLIIGKAYPVYAKMNPAQCAEDAITIFTVIFNDFQTESRCYRQMANCLSVLVEYCLTDDMIEEARSGKENGLSQIISIAELGLGVHFQQAWAHVMVVQQALFRRLRRASSPLMNGCLALLGEFRLSPAEAYKEQLDKTLGAAIATMGPEQFLSVLPLNLEATNGSSGVGRAFLLPLLKSYTTNTSLSYFTNVLMPLADRLTAKAEEATQKELALQAKVYETLVNQIWSLAPGFCDLPYDLRAAFNHEVAERFSSLLYSQPDLRPTITQALRLLVEKNQSLLKSSATDADLQKAYNLTKAECSENLEHMSSFAVNYLAVFFNVYSQIAPMFRGFLAETIKCYLTVTTPQDINATFKKVLGLLSQALETGADNAGAAAANDPSMPPPMSHTMLDLAIVMIPFLDAESAGLLYNGTASMLLTKEDEPALQKKGYKVLNHLLDTETGRQVVSGHLDELQDKLLEATASCTMSARKDRVKTLLEVVRLLPSSDLHFIPAILSEAVICSKDQSEKTRDFAFGLLVEMGRKMKAGGIVKNSRLEGMDESVPDAVANISEFFTMVTAGLAGTTAHMISATITALSRIFFEFKDDIYTDLALELLQTINVFVASNNREIVKSALGYVKVCIVVLENNVIEMQLKEIIENLLKCSHQHRSHFKLKIRHIFERLIRRFSYEFIAHVIPEEDKKLIANIQKRRLRAKRNKSGLGDSDMEDDEAVANRESAKKLSGMNDAYEEVLYGSESELEMSDDEEMGGAASANAGGKKNKKKQAGAQTFIHESEESGPIDFLDKSALSRISSAKPTQRKVKNLAKAAAFDEDEEGRLVIQGSDDEADMEEAVVEEDYYMQAQKSADGFVRDRRNRIKFKKGKGEDDDMGEDDAMDVDGAAEKRRKKKQAQRFEKVGKEYRSQKASGDVKRKGQADPYAYMPLNKVIKKKNRKDGPRVTFTGRIRK
ncbi:NUC173 domain-containing protein [Radiomyces spectabilis]|uniref:NUC173 domain-containing protein n=1 Tax=Radiomyces spectabilis TaxID=64574 RepID=UPI00221F2328|nr:NUC173 domain-containing protein [Radiomyces spectabilis]KAI8375951.1 NUC173 domain-containing protein [Radiomyces spectabilis]